MREIISERHLSDGNGHHDRRVREGDEESDEQHSLQILKQII